MIDKLKAYTSDGVEVSPGQTVYTKCGQPVRVQGIETRNGKTAEIVLQFGEWGEQSSARPLGYWGASESICSKRPA